MFLPEIDLVNNLLVKQNNRVLSTVGCNRVAVHEPYSSGSAMTVHDPSPVVGCSSQQQSGRWHDSQALSVR